MFAAMELGDRTGCKLACGIRSAKEQNVRRYSTPELDPNSLVRAFCYECISRLNGRSD